MRYFKVLKDDGTLDFIGTGEVTPEGATEITKDEYMDLYEFIKRTAVHIIVDSDEDELNEV